MTLDLMPAMPEILLSIGALALLMYGVFVGEKSIGELAQPFAISFAGASKHVKVLEGAGLIARRKVGRMQLCRLRPEPLAQAELWLRQWERFWTNRLDRLEALIEAEKAAR